jgi:hypothetical protein
MMDVCALRCVYECVEMLACLALGGFITVELVKIWMMSVCIMIKND